MPQNLSHLIETEREKEFYKLMALINEGHETVINHEEVDEYHKKVKGFLLSHDTKLIKAMQEVVETLPNPYPEDLFPKPPEGWAKELDEWCKTKGFRIDRISAHFARWQRDLTKKDITFSLQLALDNLEKK